MDPLNKENICRFDKTVVETVPQLCTPPVRNPLHDVNQQVVLNRSVKKILTATPVINKAHEKKSANIKPSILVYQDVKKEDNQCTSTLTEQKAIENDFSKDDILPSTDLTSNSDKSVDTDLKSEYQSTQNSSSISQTDTLQSDIVPVMPIPQDMDKIVDAVSEYDCRSTGTKIVNVPEVVLPTTPLIGGTSTQKSVVVSENDLHSAHTDATTNQISVPEVRILPATPLLSSNNSGGMDFMTDCQLTPKIVSQCLVDSELDELNTDTDGTKHFDDEVRESENESRSFINPVFEFDGIDTNSGTCDVDNFSRSSECDLTIGNLKNGEVNRSCKRIQENVSISESNTQVSDLYSASYEDHSYHLKTDIDGANIQDMSCSPIAIEVCCSETITDHILKDAACSSSVTDVHKSGFDMSHVAIRDTACSPFRSNILNSATNTDHISVDDTGCSPYKIVTNDCSTNTTYISTQESGDQVSAEMCDVSIQSVINHSTVACSPMQKTIITDHVDSACSPISHSRSEIHVSTMTEQQLTPIKRDLSLQVQPEMVTTLSSPFMLPHKDQFVMAVPTVSDVAMETVVVTYADKGTSAVQEFKSKHTMTEQIGCDSQTSMTPVKLPNKIGKRLTADEIRRQHPRALANQLDTLSITNERLQKEINSHGKDHNKLKHQITELKSVLKQRQSKIDELQVLESEKEQIQGKCEQLEKELLSLKEDLKKEKDLHLKEVGDLKAEIVRRDNSLELKSAQNLVLELQAELSEYSQLTDSLQTAEKLQCDVQEVLTENFNKVRAAAERLQKMKEDIDQQQVEVIAQKKMNEEESERCAKEQKEILDKYEGMKTTMETTRVNMIQFENLYSNTSADLLSATRQVQLLSSELTTTKKALQDAELTKQTLIKHVEDLEENEKIGFLEIQGLQASLKLQEDEITRLNKRLTDVEQSSSQKIKKLEGEVSRYELLARNLQHTLDSREQDIDVMEKDLFECRECIEEQSEKIEGLEAKCKTSYAKHNAYEQENLQLRDHCSLLQANCRELRESLQSTQDELQGTKMHASRLLFQQEAELKDSEVSVKELSDRMNILLDELRKKVGLQSNIDEKKKTVNSNDNKSFDKETKTPNKQSFLSLVMQAVDKTSSSVESTSSNTTPELSATPNLHDGSSSVDLCGSDFSGSDSGNISGIAKITYSETDSAEASPSTISRQKLGHNGSSAFAPIRNGSSSIKIKSGPISADMSDKSSSDDSELNLQDDKNNLENKLSLNDQIISTGDVFKEIIRLANIMEKASRFSISDLKDENEELSGHILQLQMSEKHLQAELEIKTGELEQTDKRVKDLENRLEAMSENLSRFSDQEIDIRNYQQETRNLRGQVESLEAQKELLNEQLREVLQKQQHLVSAGNSSVGNCNCQTEVLNLKMKLQKMREQSYKKDDYYEEVGRKASRRMRTLEENWKRAEAEVYRFDELVEVIRKKLVKNMDLLKENSDMKYVLRLVEGLESLPSKKDPLHPVQTAKW